MNIGLGLERNPDQPPARIATTADWRAAERSAALGARVDAPGVAVAVVELLAAEEAGRLAWRDGAPLSANPHEEAEPEGRWWAAGWLEAREAARPPAPQGREDDPGFAAFLEEFEPDARPSGWGIIPPASEWIRPPRPDGPREPLDLEYPDLP